MNLQNETDNSIKEFSENLSSSLSWNESPEKLELFMQVERIRGERICEKTKNILEFTLEIFHDNQHLFNGLKKLSSGRKPCLVK